MLGPLLGGFVVALNLAAAPKPPPRQQPLDSVAVFSDLLAAIRTDYPGMKVALDSVFAEHCGATWCEAMRATFAPYPASLISTLREKRLIESVCHPRRAGWYSCASGDVMFVALSRIYDHPFPAPRDAPAGVWVQVTFVVPCKGCETNYYGFWFRLERSTRGTWTIAQRTMMFVV